jgi:hypothetical protein
LIGVVRLNSKDELAGVESALRSIAHGDVHGPGGIEGLTMALSGDDITGRASLPRQISASLDSVAAAIDRLAIAYEERTRRLG